MMRGILESEWREVNRICLPLYEGLITVQERTGTPLHRMEHENRTCLVKLATEMPSTQDSNSKHDTIYLLFEATQNQQDAHSRHTYNISGCKIEFQRNFGKVEIFTCSAFLSISCQSYFKVPKQEITRYNPTDKLESQLEIARYGYCKISGTKKTQRTP